MIVPDINLLVYAYHKNDPNHEGAKRWWEGLVNGIEAIGVPWAVSMGFVRLMLNPRILSSPMTPSVALGCVKTWMQYPHINPINPGADHLTHLQRDLDSSGGAAKLVPDVHIAAIALEHQAVVHSNDLHFNRFPGLQWHNPL